MPQPEKTTKETKTKPPLPKPRDVRTPRLQSITEDKELLKEIFNRKRKLRARD